MRTMAGAGNKGPGPGTAPPDKVRFAAYMRGDLDSLERLRQDLAKYLGRPKFYLQSWTDTYVDVEPLTSRSEHAALKRLLKDVDADRLDCVVVHTFDRLTDRLISHEELLAKFREHDVTLMTLSPEFYHVWGKRMEEKWIASMRWYLHETQHRVRRVLSPKRLVGARAPTIAPRSSSIPQLYCNSALFNSRQTVLAIELLQAVGF